MNTAAVAAAANYSAQQVRDLEALGVIPAAARSRNGYRRFSTAHVHALRAYRHLAQAVGPVAARRAMREIRLLPRDEAAALICGFHAELNGERQQALAARCALESIRAEATTEAKPVEADSMTITELSHALGVRASTLRYWEKVGLVAPERVATRGGTARRYTLTAIREARITVALRAGGYRIPEVRTTITAVRDLNEVSDSIAALDTRLEVIAQRALALLRVGTLLAEIIEFGERLGYGAGTASTGERDR
ncbi:MerR family transcriptional regulator [Nocardia sp. BMG111209]|uniref:MerR family transcriptional regulator n=1 Tax=Nocardia sp. BMG111209 TaxID=1160137 RepID=UPI0003717D5C|nr:MerR family transcriptional regulator [Nocardia sp. BMG111209]